MRRLLSIAAFAAALSAAGAAPAQPVAPAPGEGTEPEQPDVPDVAAETAEQAPADGADIEALRAEYLRLRDLLFRSRARAAAVGDALYSTRISIHLHFPSGRFYEVSRATIRLDGANVFDDLQGAIARDKAPRFEGFIAPGRHRVSVRVETTGKDDARFESVIETSFAIQAPAGKDVAIDVIAADEGDIPYKWAKKERGTYDLRLKAKVTATERPGATASND